MSITINRTTSLDGAILPEYMPGLLYMNENQAHQFVITCTRGGTAITLTGGITGRFMRADGQTILLSGSISGGKANLTLPQSCYIVPGRFTMAIFNVVGNAVTTIYALTGNVARTQTDTLVDPGNTVPTIDNLLAEIDAMRQATADAEAAATKAVRYDTTQSLTTTQKTTARGNIDAAGLAQVVRHDAAQNLTETQKTTARGNIDAAGLAQVVRHDAAQNLTDAQKTTARENIDAAGLAQVVRHDTAQSLTDANKATARDNINAAGLAQVVRHDTAQSLTTAQKTTARSNIGAANADDIVGIENAVTGTRTGITQVSGVWEQSGINGDTGENTTGVTSQIRTPGYIYVGKGALIVEECASGYGGRVFFYDKTENGYSFISRTDQSFGAKRPHISAGDYIRYAEFNSSFGTIVPSEGDNVVISVVTPKNIDAHIMTNPVNRLYATYDTSSRILTMPSYAIMQYGNERYNIANRVIDMSASSDGFAVVFYNPKINAVRLLTAGTTVSYSWLFNEEYYYIGYIWAEYVSLNIHPCYVVNGVITTPDDGVYNKFKQFSQVEKMAVLGDSISTYVGYNETQAEGYYSDGYYPHGDVDSVDKTWWYQVANGLRYASAGHNPTENVSVSAVSRSGFRTNSDPTIVAGYDTARIDRLSINGYPAIIYIELGTNDCFGALSTIGTPPSTIDPAEIAEMDLGKVYNAAYLTVRRIQEEYSNSVVIGLIPKWVSIPSSNITIDQYRQFLDCIEDCYNALGVYVIDLRKCGITQANVSSYTIDGIHPNANGMKKLARYIVAKTLEMGIAHATNY